jgi:hypothetical protein
LILARQNSEIDLCSQGFKQLRLRVWGSLNLIPIPIEQEPRVGFDADQLALD